MSPDDDDPGRDRARKGAGPFNKDHGRIYKNDSPQDTRREVEETLDRMVSEIGDRTPIYREKARTFLTDTGKRLKDLDEGAEEYTQRIFKSKPLDALMETILRFRKTVFIITVVLSLILGYFGVIGTSFISDRELVMQSKIRGDFEVYLPGGSDAEKVLFEMKGDWSTDLATIFVETQNKFDPTDETNITDYDVLVEISNIEERLNNNKTDQGKEDGIVFVFSIATLIKTLNYTTNSIETAFLNELPGNLFSGSLPDQFKGNYSIPDNQRLISELFYQAGPDSISALVADVNRDGIYDSALIMMGLSPFVDQDELLERLDKEIAPYFVDPGVRPGSRDTTDEWMARYAEGQVHCRMTVTGPTPLAKMISDRTMTEMQKVLPWALAMVAASLLIFHRTWKILVITLVPVLFSLIISYGLMGLFLPVLTPQVVLVAPILIALGVAYGLYIANRYAEEEGIEDREKRIRYALRTTGKAIFLSAMTTAFGFGAMLTVDMATMQVLGFGLSTGILASYLTTILMTPSLVIWLNYRKLNRGEKKPRYKRSGARRIGNIPMNHSRKILVGGVLFAILSLSLSPPSEIPGLGFKVGGFSVVQANMDYISLSPADEPVVQKMEEQSDTFGSGQIGLMIVRGEPSRDDSKDGRDDHVTDSMKDYAVLNKINNLMLKINGDGTDDIGINRSEGISVVDIMKMMEIPDFTDSEAYRQLIEALERIPLGQFGIIEDPVEAMEKWIYEHVVGANFWEALQYTPDNPAIDYLLEEPLSVFIMNIFYNSLGEEIRGMLINNDYSKTIIYIIMPNMDIIETEKVVTEVDDTIESGFDVRSDTKGEKPTASPLSGFGKVLVTVNDVIVQNANQSTIMALIMVFLLLLLVFRSWRISLVTLIPVILVVFWQYFAIWGIGALGGVISPGDSMFSGDLNLFTALIGSIIIGIGVDFSIHITERIREKNFTLEGVMYAADTSGWSFIEATVTMVMGLTAVFLVNIPSIREFILLVIILLIFSAYSAIFILTSVYRLYLPRYNRLKSLKKIKG